MMRRITLLVIGLILLGLCLASCNRSISATRQSAASPVPPTVDELSKTRTAIAGQIFATETAGELTPGVQTQKTTAVPTSVAPTTPATPIATVKVATTKQATPVVKATAAPQHPAAIQPGRALPHIYWLQGGEFPFCIARRFNIDPGQLMCVNGCCNGQAFFPGQGLIIPDNPLPFRGRRSLHFHPATWRVGPGDSIYRIACFFGDVDPISLAQFNGLTPPYQLQWGQILNIP